MKITGQMHFAKALVELKKRGVAMKDVKPEELYALAEASRRCADPFREVNADAAGFPVRVSEGVWFWKLTIGAGVWLDEVEEMLGGGKSERYRLAMVYALVPDLPQEEQCEIDREFDEQADGSAAVARITMDLTPDKQIKEIHHKGRDEYYRLPCHTCIIDKQHQW